MALINNKIQRNTASQIIEVYAVNSSGKGQTGVLFGSVSVKVWYLGKAGAFQTLVPIADTSGVDVYESLSWKEVDAVNLKGIYQFGLPDSILAVTDKECYVVFEFSSGTIQDQAFQIELDDLQNVQLGLNALDKPVIENQINGEMKLLKAVQVIVASIGGATKGAGTSTLEFKPAMANQDLVGFRIKATLDSNNDRSVIEIG